MWYRGFGAWRFFLALALLLVLSTAWLRPDTARAEEEFLPPGQAFVLSAAMVEPAVLDVHFKIAPKYYMYRERFQFALTPDATRLGQPVYPVGTIKYDPTFEKDLETYHNQVTVRVPLMAGARQSLKLAVTSQGCADAGLCYPPMTHELRLSPTEAGYEVSGPGATASVPAPRDEVAGVGGGAAPTAAGSQAAVGFAAALDLGDTGFASYLSHAGWLEIIVLALALGVLLSFTPCVLPMVPILLALVAGGPGRAQARQPVRRWRGLGLAAAYVLGMSIVYTALGVAAGLIGASLSAWLQAPWVLALFAILLALLSLSMFDVFTLQAPVAMQTALNRRLSKIPGGHYSGAVVMGMLSALIVGPCVAAPLAGVLLFISQTGDLILGGATLFALAWGEGLLLLLVGASSGSLLPKAGPWMESVRRFFGILLLATAWWMVTSIVPTWLAMVGWALLALWAAVLLHAFDALPAQRGIGGFFSKGLGMLLALWAVVLIVGVAAGGRDLLQPLAPFTSLANAPGLQTGGSQASRPEFIRTRSVAELDTLLASADRPVMLDFYADWCVTCIEMEKFTFSDPAVARQMSRLILVQADVTKNTAEDRELLKRFDLFGPPGIIFFDRQGRVLHDARVIGYKNARQFGDVLARVLSATPSS